MNAAVLFVLCATCNGGGWVGMTDVTAQECLVWQQILTPTADVPNVAGLPPIEALTALHATDDQWRDLLALRSKLVVRCLPKE